MAFSTDLVWSWPFTVAPSSQRVSAATFTNRLEPPIFIIDTTTPGANKIAEYGCVLHDSDSPLEIKLYPGSDLVNRTENLVNHIEAFLGCYTLKNATKNSNTQYIGIEYGSIDQSPPFTAPSAGGVAQLRWVSGTDSWELYTAKGDGSDPVIVPLNGVANIWDSGNIPHGVIALLEVDFPKQMLRAYINGVLGATYQGAAFPTEPISHTGSHQVMSGIFATTGSSATGQTSAFISAFSHTVKGAKNFGSGNIYGAR